MFEDLEEAAAEIRSIKNHMTYNEDTASDHENRLHTLETAGDDVAVLFDNIDAKLDNLQAKLDLMHSEIMSTLDNFYLKIGQENPIPSEPSAHLEF